MNLIIDIGNTAVKAAWADGTVLGKTFRYQGEYVKKFILSLVEKERPAVLAISSVYEVSAQDESEYRNVCGELILMDYAHQETAASYGLPDWITPDRACSIIAARHLFRGKGCSIFDFGTTLTMDFLDGDGKYAGGFISLGCRTRLKALNRYSRALPLVDMPSDDSAVSGAFANSIASGVVSGIMFEIEGHVSMHPDNIVVFTGGDANYFAKRMKNSIFVICNLVLIGLALIADRYVKKVD